MSARVEAGWTHGASADAEEPPESHNLTLELEWAPAQGPWVLEIGSAHGSRRRILEVGDRVVLGSSRLADVRIRDGAVSARHVRVHATPSGVEVEDLGSKNGVFVGHARVGSVLLSAASSAFVIGRTTVTVRARQPDDDVEHVDTLPGVIGSSAAMRRVAREVRRHAKHKASVLVHGESGTGKDLVARALHELSGRRGDFVPVNVGAIAESLADAELFGHLRGAFTGAVSSRPGAFVQADRGTLFLDEIAELPLALQVKLLRVVEDGEVRAVGAAQPTRVDVRLVSASWQQLDDLVTIGRFRDDLYHRLAIVVVRLPALRDRKSDIPALAQALLARIEPEVGARRLTSAALARLVAHTWRGNVRELMSVLYRAAVACEGPVIGPHHVDACVPKPPRGLSRALRPDDALALLGEHRGNVTAAARAAGVPRSTFRAWINRARER